MYQEKLIQIYLEIYWKTNLEIWFKDEEEIQRAAFNQTGNECMNIAA